MGQTVADTDAQSVGLGDDDSVPLVDPLTLSLPDDDSVTLGVALRQSVDVGDIDAEPLAHRDIVAVAQPLGDAVRVPLDEPLAQPL